jgi:hypothetical protein
MPERDSFRFFGSEGEISSFFRVHERDSLVLVGQREKIPPFDGAGERFLPF